MPQRARPFTAPELEEALRAIRSTIAKCVKVKPKLRRGTAQHTLLVRRIAALRVATALIRRELQRPSQARSRRRRNGVA